MLETKQRAVANLHLLSGVPGLNVYECLQYGPIE